MTSFREERLQERVAEIRPKLAKARQLAETAEAENRAMTAEEQKTYDEIMAKGRSVADAVKQHRHDQEVFGFTRELSDNVIGGLDGGDLDRQAALPSPGRLSLRQQPGNRRCPPH